MSTLLHYFRKSEDVKQRNATTNISPSLRVGLLLYMDHDASDFLVFQQQFLDNALNKFILSEGFIKRLDVWITNPRTILGPMLYEQRYLYEGFMELAHEEDDNEEEEKDDVNMNDTPRIPNETEKGKGDASSETLSTKEMKVFASAMSMINSTSKPQCHVQDHEAKDKVRLEKYAKELKQLGIPLPSGYFQYDPALVERYVKEFKTAMYEICMNLGMCLYNGHKSCAWFPFKGPGYDVLVCSNGHLLFKHMYGSKELLFGFAATRYGEIAYVCDHLLGKKTIHCKDDDVSRLWRCDAVGIIDYELYCQLAVDGDGREDDMFETNMKEKGAWVNTKSDFAKLLHVSQEDLPQDLVHCFIRLSQI